MISVILSIYAGKVRKLNIGVNIFAGFTPDNACGKLTKLPLTERQHKERGALLTADGCQKRFCVGFA
jgi:hypothetical protein